MDRLSKIAAKARAMGLSYGQYVALTHQQKAQEIPRQPRKRKKRYTDPEAFELWQAGKTDAQIASVFGVSRAIIQRWRDTMELPSTAKEKIDTQKYRLVQDEDGRYYTIKIDTMK